MKKSLALLLSALLFAPVTAAAQAWPTKTVRIIVPFGPGSTPDMDHGADSNHAGAVSRQDRR